MVAVEIFCTNIPWLYLIRVYMERAAHCMSHRGRPLPWLVPLTLELFYHYRVHYFLYVHYLCLNQHPQPQADNTTISKNVLKIESNKELGELTYWNKRRIKADHNLELLFNYMKQEMLEQRMSDQAVTHLTTMF